MPRRLGDLTVSSAGDEDLWLLEGVTNLSERTVRKRCKDAHGSMLLRNLFSHEWPRDAEDLAGCTAALARDAGLAREIADVTGLSEQAISKRLANSVGKTYVGTLFPELEDEGSEDDDDGYNEGDDETDDDDSRDDERSLAGRLAVEKEWSRPRMIGRILEIIGEEAPERLRRERFHDLLASFARSGIEACLARDASERVLTMKDDSPGIASKLRLRRAGARPAAPAPDSSNRNPEPMPAGKGDRSPPIEKKQADPPGPTPEEQRGAIGPGAIVGTHYRILRAIGDRGGFGKVFEVKDDDRPDRDFVMKVADGATAEERAVNENRLREEVKIAHRVSHQNTCAYLDDRFDPKFNVYYAVMKHAGVSLQQLLSDGQPFDLSDAIEIVAQVAEGLDYAHAKKGVIHQDVKPANILVQGATGNREVRIGDWGISRRGRDTRRADGSPTVVATVVGMSPGYVAPEQWRGEVRSASDQYCLALVFCSLLEGRVFTEYYRFRGLARLTVDQNMAVQRALAPEPEDRFGSCQQFVAKLREE